LEDSGVEWKGLCIDRVETDNFMWININWTYIIVIHVINIISVTLYIFIKWLIKNVMKLHRQTLIFYKLYQNYS
jgi:hypothetical protein